MSMSWILAGVTLGVFLCAAGGAWLVARRTPRYRARRTIHLKMWFLVLLGITLAAFAFWSDSGLRRTTLHEVVLDGSPGGLGAEGEIVRQIEFTVEHPGVEHDLMLCPMYPGPSLKWSEGDVRIAATLSPDGGQPLLDDQYTFAPRWRDKNWRAEYLHFTPTAAGPHTLTLRLLSPGIPSVHVRIGDPLKTDGQRAAGY